MSDGGGVEHLQSVRWESRPGAGSQSRVTGPRVQIGTRGEPTLRPPRVAPPGFERWAYREIATLQEGYRVAQVEEAEGHRLHRGSLCLFFFELKLRWLPDFWESPRQGIAVSGWDDRDRS